MMGKIEWCDKTVNPIRTKDGGYHCTKVSTGCKNCFAERINKRFGNGIPYDNRKVEYVLNEKALDKVLSWRKPKRIFWQDVSDLFHSDLTGEEYPKNMTDEEYKALPEPNEEGCENLERVIKVIQTVCRTPQHTHLFLTKRPKNMKFALACAEENGDYWPRSPKEIAPGIIFHEKVAYLSNLHLGVSVENQQTFDERWHYLKQIPAAVRFISFEPALGALVLPDDFLALGNQVGVIVGGESGPGARPMHPGWARKVRDDCKAAGVPYFFKQWGAFKSFGVGEAPRCKCGKLIRKYHGYSDLVPGDVYTWCEKGGKFLDWFDLRTTVDIKSEYPDFKHDGHLLYRVGKKATGRQLDGREWNELPKGT